MTVINFNLSDEDIQKMDLLFHHHLAKNRTDYLRKLIRQEFDKFPELKNKSGKLKNENTKEN